MKPPPDSTWSWRAVYSQRECTVQANVPTVKWKKQAMVRDQWLYNFTTKRKNWATAGRINNIIFRPRRSENEAVKKKTWKHTNSWPTYANVKASLVLVGAIREGDSGGPSHAVLFAILPVFNHIIIYIVDYRSPTVAPIRVNTILYNSYLLLEWQREVSWLNRNPDRVNDEIIIYVVCPTLNRHSYLFLFFRNAGGGWISRWSAVVHNIFKCKRASHVNGNTRDKLRAQ